jgi:hypothetical protein
VNANSARIVGEHTADASAASLFRSVTTLQRWVEDHHYRGYEPFDGLSSWARAFTRRNEFAERLLLQLIRQCPWNIRPLMGVRPKDSTKGRGYMAWGYLLLYRATLDLDYLIKAETCLRWLDEHKAPAFAEHSWSNHFDFVSRGGSYTKDDPIIVWTALIAHAFVEAFEVTQRSWYLEIADSACRWIMQLPRERTPTGTCLSYLAIRQESIHNANMLGAGLLARVAKHNGNERYRDVARSAMQYSCSRQHADGSWWYAEDSRYHWIDNFHTGYNLESLAIYTDASGDAAFSSHLDRGLAFYRHHFFESNGRPKYYHARTCPVDIQCAAQAIDTLALFGAYDRSCRELAQKVAVWAIANLQDRSGYFYYRQYPFVIAKTPMLHWGQATMFKALARLHLTLQQTKDAGVMSSAHHGSA